MTTFIHDLLITYRAVRDSRRRTALMDRRHSDRMARQSARIAAMSDDELSRCASQWGGAVCLPELKRRGLA
jgi:hypothetical protein